MTFNELVARLRAAGIDNCRGEAAIIAEDLCGAAPSRIMADGECELPDAAKDALCRREAGEPLQYIVGKWHFMNEVYEVTPSVLIPRADTECLVEWAIKNIPAGGRFADLGTGSGCVAVSTLAARSDLSCVAVDKYPDALDVAKRNAALNGVSDRAEFLLCDILTDEAPRGAFDCILSNPPYVTRDEYSSLERELYFEPRHALTDGADGLTFYERILDVYPERLTEDGVIALEIGASQASSVMHVAASRSMSCKILKDLGGRDRVALCKKMIRSIL
ncbi:MAG: peptide chain release factor N(5)-glutamine methyltransferase [Clostridia bacterium]|nr:peptide chain release factor N(5)-glutamine methyltransferase [Clostridia bacterium]